MAILVLPLAHCVTLKKLLLCRQSPGTADNWQNLDWNLDLMLLKMSPISIATMPWSYL